MLIEKNGIYREVEPNRLAQFIAKGYKEVELPEQVELPEKPPTRKKG